MVTKTEVAKVHELLKAGKPVAGIATIVDIRPPCDLCGVPALVDGKTTHGPWANMCITHFKSIGIGLGTSQGQVLITAGNSDD